MSNIAYREDIIEEAKKELIKSYPNITKEEINEVLNITIEYIHEKIKNPEIITIRLSGLGDLYLNGRDAINYIRTNKIPKYTNILSKQVDNIVKQERKSSKLVNKTNRFLWQARKYLWHNKEFTGALPRLELLRMLEEKQNKLF